MTIYGKGPEYSNVNLEIQFFCAVLIIFELECPKIRIEI